MTPWRKTLKRIWRAVFTRLCRPIDFIVPKDPTLVILSTENGGNTKALYEYISTQDCGLTAYRYDPSDSGDSNDPHLIKSIFDLRSLWIILRAKTLVTTHSMCMHLSKRKLYVQTWHGVPLKGQRYTETGFSDKEVHAGDKAWTKYVDVFIAPSKEAAYRMCVSCMMDPRKVFYCGQARNDVLYRERRDVEKVRKILGLPECKKLILYCQTYRRGEATKFFPFPDIDYADLQKFLAEQDAVLLWRGHHMAPGNAGAENGSRIYPANRDKWHDVNDLLPHVDLLVTDYSSVYFDYLILDRPIVFVPYDLAEYERQCGFVVDDYDWWSPGDKVYDYADFKDSILRGLTGNDDNKAHRQTINKLLNYHQDGDSCQKTVEMIKKLVGIDV